MTARYGIDTSILVRLLTGEPRESFDKTVRRLTSLVEKSHAEIFASNQVIGEAYIALQHHYGITKADARAALVTVLQSGVVGPLHGASVLTALEISGGCGVLDRLIVDDYARHGLETLTLDERMARLPAARRL